MLDMEAAGSFAADFCGGGWIFTMSFPWKYCAAPVMRASTKLLSARFKKPKETELILPGLEMKAYKEVRVSPFKPWRKT